MDSKLNLVTVANEIANGSTTWGKGDTEYWRFRAGNASGSRYRSRVEFNTNNVIISSSTKIVVKATIAESNYYCY
jgi:hypothetical protein